MKTEINDGPTIPYKKLSKKHDIGKCIFDKCDCSYCIKNCCSKPE